MVVGISGSALSFFFAFSSRRCACVGCENALLVACELDSLSVLVLQATLPLSGQNYYDFQLENKTERKPLKFYLNERFLLLVSFSNSKHFIALIIGGGSDDEEVYLEFN